MLIYYIFLISTFVLVNSETRDVDKCISFTYEDGFNAMFRDNLGPCASVLRPWEEKSYSQESVYPPHEFSTKHISPKSEFSCASSFLFTMSENGVVEVTVYMSGDTPRDQLVVVVNQNISSDSYVSVGSVFLHPASENFVKGWSTHRIPVGGTGTFQGYLSFLGMAGKDSTVLVDSFRYIPPTTKDVDCQIYSGIAQPIAPTTRVFKQKEPSKIMEKVVTETKNIPQMRVEVEAGTPQAISTISNSFAHTHILTTGRTTHVHVNTRTQTSQNAVQTQGDNMPLDSLTNIRINSLFSIFRTQTHSHSETFTQQFRDTFASAHTNDTLTETLLDTLSTHAQKSTLTYNYTTFSQTETTLNLETETSSQSSITIGTSTVSGLVTSTILNIHTHTHTNTHTRVHIHTHTLSHTHIHSNGHIHIHTHKHIVNHSIVHVHVTTQTHNHTLRRN